MDDPLVRQIVNRRTLAVQHAFDAVELTIRGDDGVAHTRVVLKHHGAVVVLPILDTPEGPVVVTVRNERHTIEGWLEELPAGGIEVGEAPETAAARELREETGYAADTITPLGRFYTTPGLTDELMWAYVARGLSEVGQDLDEDEELTVHRRPLDEFVSMVESGDLADAKSMLVVLWARSRGVLPDGGGR